MNQRSEYRRSSGRRGLLAGGLVVLNLALVALNLDKHDALPVSSGLFTTDATDTTDSTDTAEAPATSDTTVVADESAAVTTASSALEVVTSAETVDNWPGGRGPVPGGPPAPRLAIIGPDGQLSLTGSAPDWATAERIAQLAGANLPGGLDAVNNQLSWHPDASADIRSGDVVIDQAATFALGQATIEPGSTPSLDLAGELLRSRPSLFVVVIGHTDDVGDAELNARLALDRANAVVEYLIGTGVVPGQIVVASAGEDDPTASNETQAGRDANRRIELQFKNFFIPPQDFGGVGQ